MKKKFHRIIELEAIGRIYFLSIHFYFSGAQCFIEASEGEIWEVFFEEFIDSLVTIGR